MYKIYETHVDVLRKDGYIKKENYSAKRDTALLLETISKVSSEVYYDIENLNKIDNEVTNTVKALKMEVDWLKKKSPVIFVESADLANELYSIDLDFEDANFNIETPFSTFSLCFPKGTVVGGVELTNALVKIGTNRDFIRLFGGENKESGIGMEEQGIRLQFLSNKNRKTYSTEVYLKNYKKTQKKNEENPLEGNVTKKLEILKKIALLMFIYNSEGDKIKKGYPLSQIKKGVSDVNKKDYKVFKLKSDKRLTRDLEESRRVKKRIPFFRQLRAERYYKNHPFWKNKKRGTRWVYVSEISENYDFNALIR